MVPAHRMDPQRALAVLAMGHAFALLLGGVVLRLEADLFPGSTHDVLEALGYLGLFLGIATFLVAYGLGGLRPWARPAAMAVATAGLALFPPGTIGGIVLLWYLHRPEVMAALRPAGRA